MELVTEKGSKEHWLERSKKETDFTKENDGVSVPDVFHYHLELCLRSWGTGIKVQDELWIDGS